jgi:hypothetical protein
MVVRFPDAGGKEDSVERRAPAPVPEEQAAAVGVEEFPEQWAGFPDCAARITRLNTSNFSSEEK